MDKCELTELGHFEKVTKSQCFVCGFSSAQFQSIISQLKTVLSDFLTAVDALLLKEGYDDAQRELYFAKVHESIATSRDALSVSE